jgi:hypothetical protein
VRWSLLFLLGLSKSDWREKKDEGAMVFKLLDQGRRVQGIVVVVKLQSALLSAPSGAEQRWSSLNFDFQERANDAGKGVPEDTYNVSK